MSALWRAVAGRDVNPARAQLISQIREALAVQATAGAWGTADLEARRDAARGLMAAFGDDLLLTVMRHKPDDDDKEIRTVKFSAEKLPNYFAKSDSESWDVYFGLSGVPGWDGQGRGSKSACAPRGIIAVDIDLDFGAHLSGKTISVDSAFAAIRAFPAAPLAVVASGGGLHVYYRIGERVGSARLKEIADRVDGWFARQVGIEGWDSAPTGDIARILRLPGTTNFKQPDQPRRVLLVEPTEVAGAILDQAWEGWPSFDAMKAAAKAATRQAARPLTRSEAQRKHRALDFEGADGELPLDAFNRLVGEQEEVFAEFLERLGARVSGSKACMPGDPALAANEGFSANILEVGDDFILHVIKIHGLATAEFWAGGGAESCFTPSALLGRVFDFNWAAAARYVVRTVLPDPDAWLAGFDWRPGNAPPA